MFGLFIGQRQYLASFLDFAGAIYLAKGIKGLEGLLEDTQGLYESVVEMIFY
jgi:hypothetical protein